MAVFLLLCPAVECNLSAGLSKEATEVLPIYAAQGLADRLGASLGPDTAGWRLHDRPASTPTSDAVT